MPDSTLHSGRLPVSSAPSKFQESRGQVVRESTESWLCSWATTLWESMIPREGKGMVMRGVLLAVLVGSLYAIGLVLFNGLDGVYDLFGLGLVVGGGEALAAALATTGGVFAIWFGTGHVVQPIDASESGEVEARRFYRPPLLGLGGLLFVLAGYLLFQGDSGRFVEDLSVGDCFQIPAEIEVVTVEIVSCEEPHDVEVYAVKQLDQGTDEPYPGLFALDESSFTVCVDDFEDFVGSPYEDSILDVFWFSPTPESWEEGDRLVTCSVTRLDFQRSVGTARGLRQ